MKENLGERQNEREPEKTRKRKRERERERCQAVHLPGNKRITPVGMHAIPHEYAPHVQVQMSIEFSPKYVRHHRTKDVVHAEKQYVIREKFQGEMDCRGLNKIF